MMHLFNQTTLVGSSLGPVAAPATGFGPALQCQAWIPSVDLKSCQKAVGLLLHWCTPCWQSGIVACRVCSWVGPLLSSPPLPVHGVSRHLESWPARRKHLDHL